ncbi:MAG: SpvB/TcaC N-terminal domain-containing protein, partial [Desulfobacterales bacterium]|nr:SpvB/TcaC N-terminal domain-containing protein [Desulfobacterales bacterium]
MAATSETQQAISLPQGGGAVSGIGETFAPDLFTGTGNFTVPIASSPGRDGFGPQLALQYSSGHGNGPFGLGWKLSIPRITRKTEKGLPRYNDDDVFVLSGAEDLVLADDQLSPDAQPEGYSVRRYRPRTEGLFARIEKWTRIHGEPQGDIHWRIVTKDNVTNRYGYSSTARIADPDNSARVYEWLLEETMDGKGNHFLYEYVQEDPDRTFSQPYEHNRRPAQTYIRRVLYGNTPERLNLDRRRGPQRIRPHPDDPAQSIERHYLFELLFDYGDLDNATSIPYLPPTAPETIIPEHWPVRDDPFSTFRAGFEIRTLRRCRRVLMLHHCEELAGAPLVRSTDFSYERNSEAGFSLLKAVEVTGYRREGSIYHAASMPPVAFGYSRFEPHKQRYRAIDARGDDLPPHGLNHSEFSLVDLSGDALPDILQTVPEGITYFWQNRGDGRLDRRRMQPGPVPTVSPGAPQAAWGDMGGDGLADLVVDDAPLAGFFESTPQGRWKTFRKFDSFPTVDLSDPNLRLVDLTGDGLADILITRDHHFLWFPCRGETGYGDPRHIDRVHDLDLFPDVYFDDPAGRVRLADMSGDGLNDIVMIHDGRIDYWPNLGYGRFGQRLTMSQAPDLPDRYNPRQLFLVDLDGTGCADLVYVDFDRVHLWFNRSGNSWSEKQIIRGTPPISDASAFQFADFFSTGTATLIWSSDYRQQTGGNYRVLDFCGGRKPHLLVEMDNNMGATTRVAYASSTQFYLTDQAAGTPWATHLPFPVQVVARTEVIDHIGRTKLVSTYRYHHGYYDGREREFRGFGRVDRIDTESFEVFAGDSLHGDEAVFDNKARAHHVPPILTKTWFHSGVYFDADNVSPSGGFYDYNDLTAAYSREFYAGDPQAFVQDPHQVEHTDNPHEAYRALRGAVLRSEVYSLDETPESQHPYTVAANRYHVAELQAVGQNPHGVYLTTQAETLSYHYERHPHDPRIEQDLVLAVDDYGQVTDSVSIVYPRREVPSEVPEQGDLAAIYTKTDYINRDDAAEFYYLGVPCQTRTFEVTGISWTSGDPLLRADDFAAIVAPALVTGDFRPFEWQRPTNHTSLEKRLVEWQRSYFRSDASAALLDIERDAAGHPLRSLSGRLPLGAIESLALPYESYTAAFTDELLALAYQSPAAISANMLKAGAYHAEPDVPGYWWAPGGQQAFDPQHFYLPRTSRDPFGFDAQMAYDDYALAVVQTNDALQNTVQAEIDYRVLQPFAVTGPNGNRSVVAFDALGLVAGSAAMGKAGDWSGDAIEATFAADLSPDDIDQFMVDPHATAPRLLDTATTRIIYDLHRYRNTGQPAYAATLARETHVRDGIPQDGLKIQIGFSYADGFGRTVQSKAAAEPDKAAPEQARWVGSGTTVYNNKGKPVQQYEPFFSGTHHFGIERHGVSPTLFYDPLARVVATLHPNHTFEKVVFDPWQQKSWDVNDMVLQTDPRADPHVGAWFEHLPEGDYLPSWYDGRKDGQQGEAEQAAAQRAAAHADTPSMVHLDSLGRPVLTVADNADHGKYATHAVLDIEGNQRAVIDAKGRIVQEQAFDLRGTPVQERSMDAGVRWMLPDAAGKPL